MRQVGLLLNVALLQVGCDSPNLPPSPVVFDSAGITIVQSTFPAWAAGEGWRLPPTPTVSIGEGGSTETTFHQIRSLLRLSDGRIAVADRGSHSIRYFDSSGQFLHRVGGAGDGPGEFRVLQQLGRLDGDSIYALDLRFPRITTLSPAGEVLSITTLPQWFASAFPLSDGGWVAVESDGYVGGDIDPNSPPGLQRPTALVLALHPNGTVRDTIGRFPGPEVALTRLDGRVAAPPAAFGRTLTTGTRGDEVLVGTGVFFGVEVYRVGEGHIRTIRVETPPTLMTEADVKRFREWVLTDVSPGPPREFLERVLDEAESPSHKAPYSRLLIDALGYLWLSDYELDRFSADRWHVFDPHGHYLGAVSMPAGFRVHEVGESYVLGVLVDEVGVEAVHLYELHRD